LHRRQWSSRISALRPLCGLILSGAATLAFAGCGDSQTNDVPGPDLGKKIAKLQRKVERQKKVADVEGMLAGLPGVSGLVVGAPGPGAPDVSAGEFTTGDAWSTIKVPIAERVLADAGGPEGLTAAQADEISRAITLSDNDAAADLFEGIERAHGGLSGGSEAVGEMLRQAGDEETVISTEGRGSFSTYGQTDWSLANQFRYMAALAGGCVSDQASRSYLFDEMGRVGGSDSYGLGAAGVPARWKGGWGPGPDGRYLVRQMGVMDLGAKRVVIAMAAIPDDGTFESGQAMLSDIAGWSASHLADEVSVPARC